MAMHADLIGQRIKLQHLKIVRAVADWGSMAKAAKHLAISQPVVSKVVADLEGMLGVRLFDRSPQGVEPTAYGRALLRRCITIFDDLRTSVDEIKFMADPTAGELRIGSTEPLLAGLGRAIMERLWRRYPRIDFRIVEADSATLLARELPERKIELALLPLIGSTVRPELEVTVLFEDRLRVIAGAKSRFAAAAGSRSPISSTSPGASRPRRSGPLMAEAFRAEGLADAAGRADHDRRAPVVPARRERSLRRSFRRRPAAISTRIASRSSDCRSRSRYRRSRSPSSRSRTAPSARWRSSSSIAPAKSRVPWRSRTRRRAAPAAIPSTPA